MFDNLFPENQQLINCSYYYGNKEEGTPDSIIIVSKDKDNEKYITQIEKPDYYFYVTNPDYDSKGKEYVNYISFDDCKKITCRYSSRYSAMAKASTSKETKDFYNSAKKNKDWKSRSELHLFPEFHASDINIEDFYIARFLDANDFNKNSYPLSIMCFDIEVDGSDYIGFPDENLAPCEVNMITAFNMEKNILYIFARKYDTDTFKNFRIIENLKKSVDRVKRDYFEAFGNFKVKPMFFPSEFLLIKAFFDTVNNDKCDYVTAWNARFDILTLYGRLKKITAGKGIMPEDIMCPEEFPEKNVYIKLDKSEEAVKPSGRVDLFQIFGYSNWIDYMCLYANINKPNGEKDSYELDFIGMEETGKGKKDLAELGYTIKDVHLKDYATFFEYACFDTLLLALIIKNTDFINLLHNIVLMTRTRPSKALKKTVCERNFAEYFYNKNGYALSNNRSYLNPSTGKKIKGAFVALLELIEKMGDINGIASNKIFMYVIDFDLSSLYPSEIRAFNISQDTLKYRIVCIDTEEEDEDLFNVTDNFFEEYISEDNINYGVKYHNFPDVEQMYELLKDNI